MTEGNSDIEFLNSHIDTLDRDIQAFTALAPKTDALKEDMSLNNNTLHKFKIEEMRKRHAEDEHDLRKRHLKFLSSITVFWLALISTASWMQGFKGILPIYIYTSTNKKDPYIIEAATFNLSDSIFIALITTTTATILGLYTIAAIWLYKGKQKEDDINKPEEK